MTTTPEIEFKLSFSAGFLQNQLEKTDTLNSHLSEPLNRVLNDEDRTLLRKFLKSKDLQIILAILSAVSNVDQKFPTSLNDKFDMLLHPLLSKYRLHHYEEHNCLSALNDVWGAIESILTKSNEDRYPVAQELWDILSNVFVRELLLTFDDVKNFCYDVCVDGNSVITPIYIERDPVCAVEEIKRSESEGSSDQPFFLSSLSQNDEVPTIRPSSKDHGAEKLISKSSSPWQSPRNSFVTPYHNAKILSPRKSANDVLPYQNMQYREKDTKSKCQTLLSDLKNSIPEPGMVRTVYLKRHLPEEPLGITLSSYSSLQEPTRNGSLQRDLSRIIIQRIIIGSLADREGKLIPGDEVIEFNGVTVTSFEDIQKAMVEARQKNILKLVVKTPGIGQIKTHILNRNRLKQKVYIRCLFKYDPIKDTLLPNVNLGVAFKSGDVLELVDSQDLNWWQVRRLDSPNLPVGLVPSQSLEERRQAFNQQAFRLGVNKKMKKVKSMFRAADSSNLLVRSDLWVYEEVVPWPPSPVHTLLLIGPNGVGRRTLKFLLCTKFPQRFSFPISDTTDSKAPPALFRIRTKWEMESDIKQGAYVEWGTVDGQHYGIRFAAIREIIATGRTALIDCQCQSVHLLHQPEFNPHVVFVSAPNFEKAKSMMEDGIRENLTVNMRKDEEILEIVEESKVFAIRNQHLYTHTLVNSSMVMSVEKLSRLVSRLEKQPGWIPAGWAYEMNLPKLAADYRSLLGRDTSSVHSAASPESAARLARPLSAYTSLQLSELTSESSHGSAIKWALEHKSNRMMQRTERSASPHPTGTLESNGNKLKISTSRPFDRNAVSKEALLPQSALTSTVCRPSSSKQFKSTIMPNGLSNTGKSGLPLKLSDADCASNDGDDDDEISSTSLEED